MQTRERVRLGLPNLSQEFTAIRERWATLTNEVLKEANIEARVDHRSLEEQGIDREPTPHIPFAAFKIERAGKHSEVAESIRADYNARVQARQDKAAERQPVPDSAPKSLEDIRREARENWLKMRAEQTGRSVDPPAASGPAHPHNTPTPTTRHTRSPHNTPAPDDDHQP